mmetsp:Transcript_32429/g.93985  ORF Transcript_32429/g.93985 Transcript_32429/m.93985 type:complete len:375 (-) Transcript_32429:276-1400(-)
MRCAVLVIMKMALMIPTSTGMQQVQRAGYVAQRLMVSRTASFRTEIQPPRSTRPLCHSDRSLLIGSCFSENMGAILQRLKFPTTVNPFGISYHPVALGRCLERLASAKPYTQEELQEVDGMWLSFDHHSRFNAPTAEECLVGINSELATAAEELRHATHLFLTLGTAWGYTLPMEEGGQVVANCHRFPSSRFTKAMTPPFAAADSLFEGILRCSEVNPDLQVVLTVSPVRHWRDGAVENSRSKASLLLAAHELVCRLPDKCEYFPSYEIVVDDLRDYRFFEADMVHPNGVAVDYIWERMRESVVHESADEAIRDFDALAKAVAHRPRSRDVAAVSAFAKGQLGKLASLRMKYPYVDLAVEDAHFRSMLEHGITL